MEIFSHLPARFRPGAVVRRRVGDEALLRLGGRLLESDPLADRLVDALAGLPRGEGFRHLEKGLAGAPRADMPEALRGLLAAAAAVPAWVDWSAVERGGAVFLRAGLAGGIVLGMNSLVRGYASPGGNKALVFSGRFQEQAARRLAETSRFVQAVSRPGGMRRYGEGFAITVKVRVMHAQVRRLIAESRRWDRASWGDPINQHDMVATILLFGVAALDGLRRLGYQITAAEAEDVVHLWRLVGHVIGVDAALLPSSYRDSLALAEMIRDTQGPPDDHARALVRTLFISRMASASSRRERRVAALRSGFMQGMARRLIGDELADQLAIPRTGWRYVGAIMRPALGVAARVNRLPLWRDVASRIGDRYWEAAVAAELEDARPRFVPPTHVAAGAG